MDVMDRRTPDSPSSSRDSAETSSEASERSQLDSSGNSDDLAKGKGVIVEVMKKYKEFDGVTVSGIVWRGGREGFAPYRMVPREGWV